MQSSRVNIKYRIGNDIGEECKEGSFVLEVVKRLFFCWIRIEMLLLIKRNNY